MSSENEMTILELDPAGDLSLSDVLYILQGVDVDRDRKVTLEKLRDFMQVNNKDVVVTGGEFKTEIKANKITITDLSTAGGGTFEYSYMDGIVRKNINGGTLWKITGNGTTLSGEILLPNLKLAQDGVHILTSAGMDTGILVKGENSEMKITGKVSFANAVSCSSLEVSGNISSNGDCSFNKGTFTGQANFKSLAKFCKEGGGATDTVNISNGNVNAGGNITAASITSTGKVKAGSGLVLKKLSSPSALPAIAENGESYIVTYNSEKCLFVYDDGAWLIIQPGGVYTG